MKKLFPFLLLFICAACSEKIVDPGPTPGIYGKITDEDGNNIADVGLHYSFLKDNVFPVALGIEDSIFVPAKFDLMQNYPNPFNPQTSIRFSLAGEADVNITILRWPSRELIVSLIDRTLPAGDHILLWNGQDETGNYISNGLYYYTLSADTFSAEKVMCLHMSDPEHIRSLNAQSAVRSDSNGSFKIDYNSLPVNKKINHTGIDGRDLGFISTSDSLKIWFIKEGYFTYSEKIQVDTTQVVDLNIVLAKQ